MTDSEMLDYFERHRSKVSKDAYVGDVLVTFWSDRTIRESLAMAITRHIAAEQAKVITRVAKKLSGD